MVKVRVLDKYRCWIVNNNKFGGKKWIIVGDQHKQQWSIEVSNGCNGGGWRGGIVVVGQVGGKYWKLVIFCFLILKIIHLEKDCFSFTNL